MTRHYLTFAVALPALALLGGCGGGTTNTSDTVTITDNDAGFIPPVANADNAATVVPMTGQDFANTAAASDAYEVAAGKLAQQKATHQALKDFGGMMVTAHTESTAKLKAAAGKANPPITPNAELTEEQRANLDTLEDATGADFDAAYRSQQIVAHQKTLAAVQAYAAGGEIPEIKAWAMETAPVVQRHLELIEGM
jgi:putative membrane protein